MSISHSDREVLSRCRLGSQLIAIDTSGPGRSRLVLINPQDLSCWDLFISIFGYGHLAYKTISLHRVADYLNRYSWERFEANDPAYLNVCALANRAMLKGSLALFQKISRQIPTSIELVQFIRGGALSAHPVNQRILWNSSLQVKHVRAQLNREYVNGNIEMRMGNFSLDSNSFLSEQRLRDAQIIVRQEITSEIR